MALWKFFIITIGRVLYFCYELHYSRQLVIPQSIVCGVFGIVHKNLGKGGQIKCWRQSNVNIGDQNKGKSYRIVSELEKFNK